MQKKIFLLVVAVVLLVSTVTNAQQVSKDVLQRFNSSVAIRVYDVASKLSLSNKDQLTLAEAYNKRDNALAEAMKRGASAAEVNTLLSDALICHYDSLLTTINFQIKSNNYLLKTFETLDAVKPLTADQKTNVTNLFLPKCSIAGCVYEDILREVLPKVLTDTAYYATLFKDEIDQKATKAMREYPSRNKLSERTIQVAGGIIYRYQKALLLANYALSNNSAEKKQLINNIDIYYRPIIDSILVKRLLISPNSQFTLAIDKGDFLKLTNDQVNQLIEKNAELQMLRKEYSLKNKGKKYNATDFQRKNLREILTEDQIRPVVQLWYQSDTQRECEKKWKELKQYNLVSETDSVSVTRDMYLYFLEKIAASDLYYEKPEIKAEKLYKNEQLFKPELLKKLDSIIAEEKAKAALRKGKNDSFVW